MLDEESNPVLNREEKRAVSDFQRNKNSLEYVYVYGVMNGTHVYKWCRGIKAGRINVHDERHEKSMLVCPFCVKGFSSLNFCPKGEQLMLHGTVEP